jgi:predicted Rossmann fold flavoprotein
MMAQRIRFDCREQEMPLNDNDKSRMDVCVLGAGPAGLFAAYHAAMGGARVQVVDGNAMAGRKLLITGGGRCNVTHTGPAAELLPAYAPYDRFLRFALHEIPPAYIVSFLEQRGVRTRTLEDGCVFPQSDQAQTVRDLLVCEAQKAGVVFRFGRRVETLARTKDGFAVGLGRETLAARRVILATGGASYPRTGSTGDGYAWARELGHDVVPQRSALIPLVTKESWGAELAGTSIPAAVLCARMGEGKSVREKGALVFTQDGIGGPAVLNLSRLLTDLLPNNEHPVAVQADLVPSHTLPQLERELIDACARRARKTVKNLVAEYVPKRLADIICGQAGCDDDLWACSLSKVYRRKLLQNLKALPLSVVRTRPLAEATITRGGVATGGIDPQTMASKTCPGLFFAGEVIDSDGPCGGYNLQICWSTGALAGRAAAR